MSLLLDLGNTRLKLAWWCDGRLGEVAGFAHAQLGFEAEVDAWLERHREARRAGAWLAAVAPDRAIERTLSVLRPHRIVPRRVETQAEALGLRVAYADPSRLGVDRWLALLAVHASGEVPALIASVGSALTIDALATGGSHLGGLIVAPPEAMRAALVARAPRLDVSAGRVVRFATSTEDAVASGCVLGSAALIERSLAELTERVGAVPRLVIGGGGAPELRDWLPPHDHRPDLVLEGLAHWAEQGAA